mmetsp:Transcript_21004/g.63982  ORF Transcript_21004/g.63982 Transcript_21004/m.63982 type:complete len:373 (+) Transcript_21004:858-1976(+)
MSSSAHTMLPMVRSAGFVTRQLRCESRSTSRGHTPPSTTVLMCDDGPSQRCDSAQHVWLSTSGSVLRSSCCSARITGASSSCGRGCPSHRFDSAQEPMRNRLSTPGRASRHRRSGARTPAPSTASRACTPSPARFPSTQSACSSTSSLAESSKLTSVGTAPCLMSTCVCSVVPAATLVSAQSASTCTLGQWCKLSQPKSSGIQLRSSTSWMSSSRLLLSSCRSLRAAISCTSTMLVFSASSAPPGGTADVRRSPRSTSCRSVWNSSCARRSSGAGAPPPLKPPTVSPKFDPSTAGSVRSLSSDRPPRVRRCVSWPSAALSSAALAMAAAPADAVRLASTSARIPSANAWIPATMPWEEAPPPLQPPPPPPPS